MSGHAAFRPSSVRLPSGAWASVLDCLCERFPAIAREIWIDRIRRGRVLNEDGSAVLLEQPHQAGLLIRYFREVPEEPAIPFREQILFRNAHLLVVDKPHFLPVQPSGRYVTETLLHRLMVQLDLPDLVPVHRIDRLTAGLVMFSCDPQTRGLYQALFRERQIEKVYEALCPALPELEFPYCHRSRLVAGSPFFRMQEVPGPGNSETRIEVQERRGALWLYRLQPVTGRKHQLRVHMAALGAPIEGDPFYPQLTDEGDMAADDFAWPLKLLARELRFRDPVLQQTVRFRSSLCLD